MAERQMRTELVGERPHRLILRTRRDPQAAVTLRSRFRDQPSKQNAADALASHARLDAEGDLCLRIRGMIGRMQLRRAAYHAVLDIGDDDSTVDSAFRGIALDEVVIHEAMKAIVSALRIEPQQVVAQLRQFLLLTQRPNVAPGTRRTGNVFVSHGSTPLGCPSRLSCSTPVQRYRIDDLLSGRTSSAIPLSGSIAGRTWTRRFGVRFRNQRSGLRRLHASIPAPSGCSARRRGSRAPARISCWWRWETVA